MEPSACFSQFAVGVRCYAYAAALLASNGIACDTPPGPTSKHDAIGSAWSAPSSVPEAPVGYPRVPHPGPNPAARTVDKERGYQLVGNILRESLERIGEPPFLAPARQTEYRLIQLPPWGPLRIVRIDGRDVVVKQVAGRRPSSQLRPSIVAHRRVFRAERSLLSDALEKMDFWNTPVLEEANRYRDSVLWVLEVRSSSQRHAVLRGSNSMSPRSLPGPFGATCELMLRLGG